MKLLVVSSNPGKLREYRTLCAEHSPGISVELLSGFAEISTFEESAPTFAENAAGKALYYSRFTELPVLADDSGLAVAALGGAPGVHSARYGGPGLTDAERTAKLLAELRATGASDRRAEFICVIALAKRGGAIGVFSDCVQGEIADAPRGTNGFGYDPVFFVPALGKTFAEIAGKDKNRYSHRGKAFRKLLDFLRGSPCYSSPPQTP
jgi:XTP/dITP diphosphohydrolase